MLRRSYAGKSTHSSLKLKFKIGEKAFAFPPINCNKRQPKSGNVINKTCGLKQGNSFEKCEYSCTYVPQAEDSSPRYDSRLLVVRRTHPAR